jgi:hypothetical protein
VTNRGSRQSSLPHGEILLFASLPWFRVFPDASIKCSVHRHKTVTSLKLGCFIIHAPNQLRRLETTDTHQNHGVFKTLQLVAKTNQTGGSSISRKLGGFMIHIASHYRMAGNTNHKLKTRESFKSRVKPSQVQP